MVKAHTQPCPVARTLNILGDRWTLVIIREAFYGATRFSEFERRTGIAKNILTERLGLLTREGLMTKTPPKYQLTAKGRALLPILVALFQWGEEHLFEPGTAPVRLAEKSTGLTLAPMALTSRTGAPLAPSDITVLYTQPNAPKDPQT